MVGTGCAIIAPANRYSAGEGIKKTPARQSQGCYGAFIITRSPFLRGGSDLPGHQDLPDWLDRGWSSDCHSRRDCAGIPPDLLPY